MAIDRTPVLKRCRQLGIDPVVMGINKTSNREPRRRRRQESEYGMQLREKQKAKFIYGVLEKPFRNYFEKASRMKGQVGENLMVLLESRLDNVIFRLGWARTRREARQIVGHRHVLVNGKIVNIPSYLIKAGDTVEIKEKAKSSERYKEIIEMTSGRIVPTWLESDKENLKGAVKALPSREEIDVPVDELQIVEVVLQVICLPLGSLCLRDSLSGTFRSVSMRGQRFKGGIILVRISETKYRDC